MAKVDLSGAGSAPKKNGPGTYIAKVDEAEEAVSKKGDPMFRVCLVDESGRTLAYDYLMLAGKGVGIGVKKLEGFGINVKDGDAVEASALLGRRVKVHLIEDERDPKYMVVDIRAGSCCGYDPVAQDGGGASSKPLSGGKPDDGFDDIPF